MIFSSLYLGNYHLGREVKGYLGIVKQLTISAPKLFSLVRQGHERLGHGWGMAAGASQVGNGSYAMSSDVRMLMSWAPVRY